MLFAHDTIEALISTAELVNSADHPDTLTTIAALDAFLARHGVTGSRHRGPAELAEIRELRGPLRDLLIAPRDDAVRLTNEILGRAEALPQLVRHDDTDWHLHVVAASRPLATRLAVEAAMAMVDVIRLDESSRIFTCERDDCEGIVVDLSRNRSRRYCSPTCSNRAAVAAYRARRGGVNHRTRR
ncbi:MAG: CGNR zinc finger domain-containing protein [Nocardioides sp.]